MAQGRVETGAYVDIATKLLESAEQRLARSDHEDLEQVIALGNAWATLAIHERLAGIEFQLSQLPHS